MELILAALKSGDSMLIAIMTAMTWWFARPHLRGSGLEDTPAWLSMWKHVESEHNGGETNPYMMDQIAEMVRFWYVHGELIHWYECTASDGPKCDCIKNAVDEW